MVANVTMSVLSLNNPYVASFYGGGQPPAASPLGGFLPGQNLGGFDQPFSTFNPANPFGYGQDHVIGWEHTPFGGYNPNLGFGRMPAHSPFGSPFHSPFGGGGMMGLILGMMLEKMVSLLFASLLGEDGQQQDDPLSRLFQALFPKPAEITGSGEGDVGDVDAVPAESSGEADAQTSTSDDGTAAAPEAEAQPLADVAVETAAV